MHLYLINYSHDSFDTADKYHNMHDQEIKEVDDNTSVGEENEGKVVINTIPQNMYDLPRHMNVKQPTIIDIMKPEDGAMNYQPHVPTFQYPDFRQFNAFPTYQGKKDYKFRV